MAEAGLKVRPEWVVPSSFGLDGGHEAARQLMVLQERPTAIFAVNDNTAIGALSALTEMGLSVPKDVSVVGYNDIPIVSHLPTPPTTVRIPFDQIATRALELVTEGVDAQGKSSSARPRPQFPADQRRRRSIDSSRNFETGSRQQLTLRPPRKRDIQISPDEHFRSSFRPSARRKGQCRGNALMRRIAASTTTLKRVGSSKARAASMAP